ncbi:glycosyltransferase family 4 protein [Terrarubrum flagellatum]|uniref:glycosyltransferase family 4 protein n=1 Tax=Terrirubrum flagellatum TaxID=2895980 RepID=UPI003144EDA2
MVEVCLFTKSWRSGAAWVAQQLAQGLAEAGAHVTFISPMADPATREPKHERVVRIFTPRELVDAGSGRAARIAATLKRIGRGAAALIAQRLKARNYIFSIPEPLPFTLPLFALLRLTGARIIFIVHDAIPNHAWRFGSRLGAIERWGHRLSYLLASRLVVMTPQLKQTLTKTFRIAPEKIAVIPHGPFILNSVPPLPGRGALLQFGAIRRNKSVADVIKAVLLARKSDPQLSLVIAGQPHAFERDYWDECKALIAQDPDGFMLKIGFIPDEELPALLAGIDAFVLAYREFDSQSGVGVLAALNARPVIGTMSGGLSELFAEGMCGELIAEPVTPQAIADAILLFRRRPVEEWRETSAAGAERMRAASSWTSIGAAYLALINNQPSAT